MSSAVRLVVLVALWLLAWGEASPANLLSGVVVAALLLAAFPPAERSGAGVRPSAVGIARLAGYVAVQMVVSNVLVAREIVSPRNHVRTGVLAYDVGHPSDLVITAIANIIALTPGTMTVEATREPGRLYVHFLLLGDLDEARRTVAHLEDLVVAALRPAAAPEGSRP